MICILFGGRRGTGPRFNTKMSSYRKSHCGDTTVVRSSYLHNGISYTGKMTSSYWISRQNAVTARQFRTQQPTVKQRKISFGAYKIQWRCRRITAIFSNIITTANTYNFEAFMFYRYYCGVAFNVITTPHCSRVFLKNIFSDTNASLINATIWLLT